MTSIIFPVLFTQPYLHSQYFMAFLTENGHLNLAILYLFISLHHMAKILGTHICMHGTTWCKFKIAQGNMNDNSFQKLILNNHFEITENCVCIMNCMISELVDKPIINALLLSLPAPPQVPTPVAGNGLILVTILTLSSECCFNTWLSDSLNNGTKCWCLKAAPVAVTFR